MGLCRRKFRTVLLRLLQFGLVSAFLLTVILSGSVSAIERNRKNLLKLQLKTDIKKSKSRIVMRLNQGGYYEVEEDREHKKFLLKLFEFHNYGALPIKVVNDPMVKGVNLTKREQYLEVAVYLRVASYTFNVSMFDSPAMCVVDIKATEPLIKKKPAKLKATDDKSSAAGSTSKSELQKNSKSKPSELSQAVAKAVVKPKSDVKSGLDVKTESNLEQKVEVKSGTKAKIEQKKKNHSEATSQKVASQPKSELETETENSSVKVPAKPMEPEKSDVNLKPETKSKTEIATKIETVSDRPEIDEKSKPKKSALPVENQLSDENKPSEVVEEEPEVPTEVVADRKIEKPKPQLGRDPVPGQDLFDQGLKAYQEGDLIAAEEFFKKLVLTFPDSPLNVAAQFRCLDAKAQTTLIDNGSRRIMSGLIDEFLAKVRAHSDHPDAPWALMQVARLYEEMEFFYEAAGVYKALIKRYPLSPFSTAANFALARLNFSLKRYEEAYKDFSKLLERQPDGGFSVYAHYYRANAQQYLGDPQQALAEYRVGIALDPDFLQRDSLSLYLLGSTYHRLQRYSEAKEYFLMMRNLFPNDKNTPQALAKIGEIFVIEKRYPEAMQMFTTVVKEFPGSKGDIVSRLKMAILGEKSAVRRKLEEINPKYAEFLNSEKAYLYLIENHPESPFTDIARLDLGRLYYNEKKYEKARRVLGVMLERRLDPGLREAAFTNLRETIFAEIKEDYDTRKYDQIVALQNEYSDNFLSRPSAVYPFLWVGEALHNEGFKTGALKVYREVKRFKPKPTQRQIIDWGIADLLIETRHFDEAEEFLGKIDFKKLDSVWLVRMLLLRAKLQIHRDKVDEAFTTLESIKPKLASKNVRERVDVGALEADLWLRQNDQNRALDTLRSAVSFAYVNPEEISVELRLLLGFRLARMLYEQESYREADVWFTKLALLAPVAEIAEILYWRFRCQLIQGKEKPATVLLARLEKEFPGDPWTSLAKTASKDFRWQQERKSSK